MKTGVWEYEKFEKICGNTPINLTGIELSVRLDGAFKHLGIDTFKKFRIWASNHNYNQRKMAATLKEACTEKCFKFERIGRDLKEFESQLPGWEFQVLIATIATE